MSSYTLEHQGALADVADAGAAVSFSLTTAGTYDEATDTYSTPTTTTVSGYAVEMEGDPDAYRDLGLVQSSPVRLFFTPSTIGSLPKPGYRFTWGGVSRTLKSIEPLAPNGTAICATIIGAA